MRIKKGAICPHCKRQISYFGQSQTILHFCKDLPAIIKASEYDQEEEEESNTSEKQ